MNSISNYCPDEITREYQHYKIFIAMFPFFLDLGFILFQYTIEEDINTKYKL